MDKKCPISDIFCCDKSVSLVQRDFKMGIKQGKILIIDDNEDILFTLKLLLRPLVESIVACPDPAQINALVSRERYDVIILDMNFSRDAVNGREGFYWLEQILTIDPQAVVIFVTAYADTERTVRAIKAGATDFIAKPWQNDKLLATVSSALQLSFSRREVALLKEQKSVLSDPVEHAVDIIGESAAMQAVFQTIRKLAHTDANILILGENGTGKDLIAKSIYQQSSRCREVYVPIDLGSIPESLFESELFGYEAGAFTDARKGKPGRMEVASGGTLFLNEVGNLSLPLQAKLLSAIEKREVIRLGATRPSAIDIRLISATNADIYTMVDDGNFRQDLLYRINTVEIHIPPLREREKDILLLADYYLQRYNRKYKKSIKGIVPAARNRLMQYAWPGNVRELQHAVERAVILSEYPYLDSRDFIFRSVQTSSKEPDTFNLEEMERETIRRVLGRCDGNISRAADLLGITRASLYRRIEKYHL